MIINLDEKLEPSKIIKIKFKNKEFLISTRISTGYFKDIISANELRECEMVLATMIFEQLDEADASEIKVQDLLEDETIILQFVNGMLKDNVEIAKIYNNENDSNTVYRFVESYKKYMTKSMRDISEFVQKEFLNSLNGIANIIKPNFENIVGRITNIFKEEIKSFNRFLENSAEILEPILLEEINMNLDWGEYGWLILSSIPFGELKKPENIEDANLIMEIYLTDDNICDLINNNREVLKNNEDLEIAISLLEQKNYKPCCMLLISILESFIICRFSISKKQRPSGKGGANIINRKLKCNDDRIIIKFLLSSFKVLLKVFEDGHDFISDDTSFSIPNRNYLMHGMSKRKYDKNDCMKLFILLYNIMNFEEYIPQDIENK